MSTEISIKQLPQITEINNDDLLLVQTPNATNTLLFSNFVIGLDNTTFSSTITQNSTDIETLSTEFSELNTDIESLSTDVNLLSTNIDTLSGLTKNIDTTNISTFNELSAGSLSANGYKFPFFPSHSQTIYKSQTNRIGNGSTVVELDLAASITLKNTNSKVKVNFSIPGSINENDHTLAFVVQDSTDGITYTDVSDFLASSAGSAVQGTILLGGDSASEEGHTSSFTGIYTPSSLGAGNILYIRIGMRLESSTTFVQNRSINTDARDAAGISILLIEEIFTE